VLAVVEAVVGREVEAVVVTGLRRSNSSSSSRISIYSFSRVEVEIVVVEVV
jgi:hypothetical protein